MRKLILLATISLLATQAHAGGSRSLSLAATNPTEQATAPAAPQSPTAPQTVQPPATQLTATARPATTPAASTPAQQATTPATAATIDRVKTTVPSKPRRRELSDEARLIRELHRHGIYW